MVTDKGGYLEYYEPDPLETRKEELHQIDSFQWLSYHHPEILAWHSKNEGVKTMMTAIMDKQGGLRRGVSDLVMLIGLGNKYPFAAIELKRVNKSGKHKASAFTKEQKEFLADVRLRGGFAAVAYGFEQFKLAVADMIK